MKRVDIWQLEQTLPYDVNYCANNMEYLTEPYDGDEIVKGIHNIDCLVPTFAGDIYLEENSDVIPWSWK